LRGWRYKDNTMPQIDTRLDEFGIVQVEIKITETEESEKHLEAWDGFVEATKDITSLAEKYPDAVGMRCAGVEKDGQQLSEIDLAVKVAWYVGAEGKAEEYVRNILAFLETKADFNCGDFLNDGLYPVGCHTVLGLIYANSENLFLATDYMLYYPNHFKIAQTFENIFLEKGWEDGLLYMIARFWNRDADLEEYIRYNGIHRGSGDNYDVYTKEAREKIIFDYYLPNSFLKTQIIENGVKRTEIMPPSEDEIIKLLNLVFPRSNTHKLVSYLDKVNCWIRDNTPSS
jgi:hypothetical protein